jgi:ABC-2 type transport system ATP-binding protein
MAHPLEIRNLVKKYDSLCAVNNVSFNVEKGEIFGLLGPNGAGKTSIISCITSLEMPSSGTVEVFGNEVQENPKITKSRTGCVPQELVHHGFFTAEEILHFHSGYYGCSNNDEQINFLLKRLDLYEHRHKSVKQLSGGMKRRLLIAKALVHKPQLLLLDEPTAGVDIELRSNLWKYVRELKDTGVSILLTTHYLEEAEQLCDRIGIIDHGVLKEIGTTSSIITRLSQRRVEISLLAPLPAIKHPDLRKQNDLNLIFSLPAKEPLGSLLQDLQIPINKIKDINIKEGNLEEAFNEVLGNNHHE